jgi:hypothetical protein
MSQHASAHRAHLQLESLEDRCTPSSLLAEAWTQMPIDQDGSSAAQVRSREDAPDIKSAARVRASQQQVVPIFTTFRCFGDATTRATRQRPH